MRIPRTKLVNAIAGKLSGDPATLSKEIAAYLLSEHRVGELDSLMRDLKQYRADNGSIEVEARSAFALDEATKGEIRTRIKAAFPQTTDVVITEVIEPNLVGGVRLSLANQQMDLSIRAKLNKFKQLTLAGKE